MMSKTHAEPSYSNYRLTVRLELENQPGIFASVVNLLAKERANLGAVDIVQVTKDHMVRDITFDVDNEAHGQRILDEFRSLNKVKVISFSDPIFFIHLGGKIRVENKIPILTRNQLSMAYTPGVAKVSKAIAEDVSKVYT